MYTHRDFNSRPTLHLFFVYSLSFTCTHSPLSSSSTASAAAVSTTNFFSSFFGERTPETSYITYVCVNTYTSSMYVDRG